MASKRKEPAATPEIPAHHGGFPPIGEESAESIDAALALAQTLGSVNDAERERAPWNTYTRLSADTLYHFEGKLIGHRLFHYEGDDDPKQYCVRHLMVSGPEQVIGLYLASDIKLELMSSQKPLLNTCFQLPDRVIRLPGWLTLVWEMSRYNPGKHPTVMLYNGRGDSVQPESFHAPLIVGISGVVVRDTV